ncbi:MAG: hypothetical protein R2729_09455 [Bryobacteraceae bacterium]
MSDANTSPAAAPFTKLERFLQEKTEEAIRDGIQIERWCRDRGRQIQEQRLDLKKEFAIPNEAIGYFGTVAVNGKPRSVMGVRQNVQFGRIEGRDPEQRLTDFVLGEFLPRAHWVYPDGYEGGFTIVQTLYKDAAGQYGRFPEAEQKGCVDWRRLGKDYMWAMLTVQIHDFVMKFGPYLKRFNEAACVVMHPDFVHIRQNPSPGRRLEVAVGYPFVEYAPIPNNFGFGPGKFGSAVKLYAFFLTDDNRIEVEMDFAAAPRCSKVFDFSPSIPDPVYGGAAVLEAMTFGLWKAQPFHDWVDAGMVSQHARVHQALMDGSAKVWREWSAR